MWKHVLAAHGQTVWSEHKARSRNERMAKTKKRKKEMKDDDDVTPVFIVAKSEEMVVECEPADVFVEDDAEGRLVIAE